MVKSKESSKEYSVKNGAGPKVNIYCAYSVNFILEWCVAYIIKQVLIYKCL